MIPFSSLFVSHESQENALGKRLIFLLMATVMLCACDREQKPKEGQIASEGIQVVSPTLDGDVNPSSAHAKRIAKALAQVRADRAGMVDNPHDAILDRVESRLVEMQESGVLRFSLVDATYITSSVGESVIWLVYTTDAVVVDEVEVQVGDESFRIPVDAEVRQANLADAFRGAWAHTSVDVSKLNELRVLLESHPDRVKVRAFAGGRAFEDELVVGEAKR